MPPATLVGQGRRGTATEGGRGERDGGEDRVVCGRLLYGDGGSVVGLGSAGCGLSMMTMVRSGSGRLRAAVSKSDSFALTLCHDGLSSGVSTRP